MAKITLSALRKRSQEYVTQGEALMKEGRLDHAIALFYRGLSLAEILAEGRLIHKFQLLIAQVLHDQGQAEQVVQWCDLALAEPIEPGVRSQILNLKILNLIRIGQFQRADGLIEEVIRHPELIMQRVACINRGLFHICQFRYLNQFTLDRAETYLNQADQLCRDEVEDFACRFWIYYYKALCFVEEGLFYYARNTMLTALEILEQNHLLDAKIPRINILNELGRVSMKIMDYDAALNYLNTARQQALQMSFQLGLAYNIYYRGLLYMEMLSPEMACTHLLTASFEFLRRKYYPEAALIYLYLSQLYQSKNSEKSEKYLALYQSNLGLCDYLSESDSGEEVYQWMST